MKFCNKRAITSKCRYVGEKIIECGRIYEKKCRGIFDAGDFFLKEKAGKFLM